MDHLVLLAPPKVIVLLFGGFRQSITNVWSRHVQVAQTQDWLKTGFEDEVQAIGGPTFRRFGLTRRGRASASRVKASERRRHLWQNRFDIISLSDSIGVMMLSVQNHLDHP